MKYQLTLTEKRISSMIAAFHQELGSTVLEVKMICRRDHAGNIVIAEVSEISKAEPNTWTQSSIFELIHDWLTSHGYSCSEDLAARIVADYTDKRYMSDPANSFKLLVYDIEPPELPNSNPELDELELEKISDSWFELQLSLLRPQL